MESGINKKLIAKNTMMLYLRMLFVMAVTFFTTRVVLRNLGSEDYGIYNVVGGFVSMLAFLNTSMASSTQRFLTVELGKKDLYNLKLVFSQSLSIHFLIAFFIILLAETVGLWFVNGQLNIPLDRHYAAIWAYQFAIFSFVVSVVTVPYNALIVAHENMSIYAWISILDVSLKLVIAYVITVISTDKLSTYAFLMFMTALIPSLVYWGYCKKKYEECKIVFIFDKKIFFEIFSFAGWNIIGNLAYVLRSQGSNILLNIFFGPVVNAARGISYQVESALSSFVANFQMASNPQIIKSYAVGAYDDTMKLVCQCSKFSFYLILILSFPVIFQADYVLGLWLEDVPPYTVSFVQIMLLNSTIDSISGPLKTHAKATGNIKYYMLIQGGFFLFSLPVIFLFLKLGYSPLSSMIILLVFTSIGVLLRMFLVYKIADGFSLSQYANVLLNGLFVLLLCAGVSHLFSALFETTSFLLFFMNTLIIIISSSLMVYFVGLNRAERSIIESVIKKIFKR